MLIVMKIMTNDNDDNDNNCDNYIYYSGVDDNNCYEDNDDNDKITNRFKKQFISLVL